MTKNGNSLSIPDVRNIIELGDDRMLYFGAIKPVCFLDLRAEVAENDDSRLVWTNKNRANEQFKVLYPFFMTARSLLGG